MFFLFSSSAYIINKCYYCFFRIHLKDGWLATPYIKPYHKSIAMFLLSCLILVLLIPHWFYEFLLLFVSECQKCFSKTILTQSSSAETRLKDIRCIVTFENAG